MTDAAAAIAALVRESESDDATRAELAEHLLFAGSWLHSPETRTQVAGFFAIDADALAEPGLRIGEGLITEDEYDRIASGADVDEVFAARLAADDVSPGPGAALDFVSTTQDEVEDAAVAPEPAEPDTPSIDEADWALLRERADDADPDSPLTVAIRSAIAIARGDIAEPAVPRWRNAPEIDDEITARRQTYIAAQPRPLDDEEAGEEPVNIALPAPRPAETQVGAEAEHRSSNLADLLRTPDLDHLMHTPDVGRDTPNSDLGAEN